MISDKALLHLKLFLYKGVGPKTAYALLHTYQNDFEAVFRALKPQEGWDERLDQELHDIEREGVWVICPDDEAYPQDLIDIEEPPLVLYGRGDQESLNTDSIAVVGTRFPSTHARIQAYTLGSDFTRAGITVVSGLAKGIDGAAHRGVLAAGGQTVAVLGSGLLEMYPSEHKSLAQEIERSGCVVSELALHAKPNQGTFPRRNRIVNGLSKRGVVVVEGAHKSGSLITARMAQDEGRTVYAMPGLANSANTKGNHTLLKEGALFIEQASDIQDFPTGISPEHQAFLERNLSEDQQWILQQLSKNACNIDQLEELGQKKGLTLVNLNSILTLLELRGFIQQFPGKKFVKR